MHNETLNLLNSWGIIPGPEETEAEYEARADYCLKLKETIEKTLKDKIPFSPGDAQPRNIDSALAETENLYGIRPEWVPIFFSNAQLTPWHGGCAWIFQTDLESPKSAFLQLRKQFSSSESYLGLYQRKEILSHELAHVGRMSFEEPKFEEFLAYQSSSASWRRLLGPIIQSSWEGILFAAILLIIFILDIFLIFFGDYASYLSMMWLKVIPLALIAAGLIRLSIRHQQLKKCRHSLTNLTSNPLTINAILYRLTDDEIMAFGKMAKKDLIEYIEKQKECSLRWRAITEGYLDDSFPHTKSPRLCDMPA
jgi:hypothetical protein